MGLRFFYPKTRHGMAPAALIILLLALIAYSCGDSSQTKADMEGTWQRNVVSGTGSFVGLLTLGRDGSFTFTFDGHAVGHEKSEGRYSLSGRDIKFENSSCKGVGRYRYLLKDSTLAFIPLADSCARRKAVLSGEWQKRDKASSEPN